MLNLRFSPVYEPWMVFWAVLLEIKKRIENKIKKFEFRFLI